MDRKEVLKSWRIDESVVKLVNTLSETLGIKKGSSRKGYNPTCKTDKQRRNT